jgi:hypothetical protein
MDIGIHFINILCFETVDFTECDPTFQITTPGFSESTIRLSETDDVTLHHTMA